MGFRDNLTPDELDRFEEWAKFQREGNIKEMAKSAMVFSVYPPSGEFDIDYALQVGAMILLEKPVLLLIEPGQVVPEKLLRVADKVIRVSRDQVDVGSKELAEQIKGFMGEFVKGEAD